MQSDVRGVTQMFEQCVPRQRAGNSKQQMLDDHQHVYCYCVEQLLQLLQLLQTGWLGSRVVSMLDSGVERLGIKSPLQCCRVTVLGKLFTPIVPLFTKQQNW